MLNELPNSIAVATVANPPATPDAALVEKCSFTNPCANQLSSQHTDSDK